MRGPIAVTVGLGIDPVFTAGAAAFSSLMPLLPFSAFIQAADALFFGSFLDQAPIFL